MSKPTTPLDSELAKIFGNNTRIFRAMRELFKQAGDLSPIAIEDALLSAGSAGTAANQALDVIERLTQAVELLALMPRDIDNIRDDDLTPRQEFIIPDTLADLAPVADQVGTDNSTDVTLAGSPNYITILDQVITRNLINLVSHVTGILPLTKGGTGSSTLTAAEVAQIENINTRTISNLQWGFLGNMNQNVTTTSNVSFGVITASGSVTGDNFINATTDDMSIGAIAGRNRIQASSTVINMNNAANQVIMSWLIDRTAIRPGGNNITDLGTDALKFKNLKLSGIISTTNTTDSTSTTTGAGQIAGGLGVVKNLHVGGETFLNLPTISTGTSGSLWNDSGTVKVVP